MMGFGRRRDERLLRHRLVALRVLYRGAHSKMVYVRARARLMMHKTLTRRMPSRNQCVFFRFDSISVARALSHQARAHTLEHSTVIMGGI